MSRPRARHLIVSREQAKCWALPRVAFNAPSSRCGVSICRSSSIGRDTTTWWCTASPRTRYGWRTPQSVFARWTWRNSSAAGEAPACCSRPHPNSAEPLRTLPMGPIRRLPEALQEDPGAPLSRDVRDSGAGGHSAADHPEYSRRGDRSPERRPVASADCRADHLQPVLATDVDYSRVSRELHGPQHGLRDDVAVFPPYTVAAVLVLRQTQDRRYLRALPGEPHDPRVPHGIDRDDGAQSADGLHLLHNHVPLQREDDAPVDRFRHSDHGAHRDRHAEDQELCTRGFLRVDRSEILPDGSAGRRGNHQGNGHRADRAA